MARKTNTSHLTPDEKNVLLQQENERLRHIIGVQKEEYKDFKTSSSKRVNNLEGVNSCLRSEIEGLTAQTEKLKARISLLKKSNDFLVNRSFFKRLFNVLPE